MGYYTDFTVTAEGPDAARAFELLKQNAGYEGWDVCKDKLLLQDAKWYDWLKDVEKTSAEVPHAIIVIEGEGEESGDVWKAWAHKGHVDQVKAVIEFPEPKWVENTRAGLQDAAKKAVEEAELAQLAALKAKYESDD